MMLYVLYMVYCVERPGTVHTKQCFDFSKKAHLIRILMCAGDSNNNYLLYTHFCKLCSH